MNTIMTTYACLHPECVVKAGLFRPIFQELADSNKWIRYSFVFGRFYSHLIWEGGIPKHFYLFELALCLRVILPFSHVQIR